VLQHYATGAFGAAAAADIWPPPRLHDRDGVLLAAFVSSLVLASGGVVGAPSMLLCVDSLSLAGELNAAELGCPAGSGAGVGSDVAGYPGGGAGHAGAGGAGVSGKGSNAGGAVYGNASFPDTMGSGGGSEAYGGAGGGVVLIQAYNSITFLPSGLITARGKDGSPLPPSSPPAPPPRADSAVGPARELHFAGDARLRPLDDIGAGGAGGRFPARCRTLTALPYAQVQSTCVPWRSRVPTAGA
jgi:hypothetical protein